MLLGNAISLSTTVTDTSGAAANPATLTLTVTKPDGTIDSFAIGALTHGGTGSYSYTYMPGIAGEYEYLFTATVPSYAANGVFFADSGASALVTLADAKVQIDETATDRDDQIQMFIDAATELVEHEIGPVIPRAVTETFDGGTREIVLNYSPIVSIDSVIEYANGTENDLTLVAPPYATDTYGYRADLVLGRIVRWSSCFAVFAPGWQNVAVSYTAGRPMVPPTVREATLLLVQHMWETQQSGRTAKAASNPGIGYTMPYRVVEALRPYKRAPRVA